MSAVVVTLEWRLSFRMVSLLEDVQFYRMFSVAEGQTAIKECINELKAKGYSSFSVQLVVI